MSILLQLAKSVADNLAEFQAELLYAPEFELRNLDAMRVVVVPCSITYKTVSRCMHEYLPKIQIGVLKRCNEDELDRMIQFVEELGRTFINKKIGRATCISVEYNPIYSPEHLRERRQFTSVVELTFKMVDL